MAAIQAIVFWLEGVIIPHLTPRVLAAAGVDKKELAASQMLQLKRLEKACYGGRLTPVAYLAEAAAVLGEAVSPEALSSGQVSLSEGMLPLLTLLSQSYQLFWVTSLPAEWMAAVRGQWMADSGPPVTLLEGQFPGLTALIPSLEAALGGAPYLLIDDDAHRSMAAIRMGLKVNIFVDAGRLRRDLWLWGLVDT
jgi:hypothetical protein